MFIRCCRYRAAALYIIMLLTAAMQPVEHLQAAGVGFFEKSRIESMIKERAAETLKRYMPDDAYSIFVYGKYRRVTEKNITHGQMQVGGPSGGEKPPPQLPGFSVEKKPAASGGFNNMNQFFEISRETRILSVHIKVLYDKSHETADIESVRKLIEHDIQGNITTRGTVEFSPTVFYRRSAQQALLNFITDNYLLLILFALAAVALFLYLRRLLKPHTVEETEKPNEDPGTFSRMEVATTSQHSHTKEDAVQKTKVNRDILTLKEFETQRDLYLEKIIEEIIDSPILSRYFFMNSSEESTAIIRECLFTHSLKDTLSDILKVNFIDKKSDSVLQTLGNELHQAKLIAGLKKIYTELLHFLQINVNRKKSPARMLKFLTPDEIYNLVGEKPTEVLFFTARYLEKEQFKQTIQKLDAGKKEQLFMMASNGHSLGENSVRMIHEFLKKEISRLNRQLLEQILLNDDIIDITVKTGYFENNTGIYEQLDRQQALKDRYSYMFFDIEELETHEIDEFPKILNRFSNEMLAALLCDPAIERSRHVIISSLSPARQKIVNSMKQTNSYVPEEILSAKERLFSDLKKVKALNQ